MNVIGKRCIGKDHNCVVIPLIKRDDTLYTCYVTKRNGLGHDASSLGHLFDKQMSEVLSKYGVTLEQAREEDKLWNYRIIELTLLKPTKKTNRRVKDENIKHTSLWA